MLLSCYVLGKGTIFLIPLSNKISIEKEEYSIESLTIDILKKYIWEQVVGIFNEVDIEQKLEGNKMKPNFLFIRTRLP
ncbi:hypothetical protein RhiirA4_491474 [Rhizophagus irregularis]|uniref:Uncharacterized protein n=1 Tax=Rhizophagus irregularis TaxID=588596 RepID=A0A2I1HWG9_9GLOM|nr:hypothetical protein RhiirA4_491474 [Rhizophagus irregularis]